MRKRVLKRFFPDESGLELVEYAIMTALIVVTLVLAIGALSSSVSGRFGEVKGVISKIGSDDDG